MKITKSKRYKRFVSFSGKSRSFIREKPLILSSIIHNNKTITITLFIASRKRRSINTFQFVKPIQRCLINAGDILLPIYIYIYIYISIDIDRYTKVPDRIRGKPTTNHEAIDRTTSSTCFSEYRSDKTDFSVITNTRMAPSNEQPWKLINLRVRAPSFVGW